MNALRFILLRPGLAAGLVIGGLWSCSQPQQPARQDRKGPQTASRPAFAIRAGKPIAAMPGEKFFRNVRQLTFGGENAEAYWSNDGTKLILQTRGKPYLCDQIEILDLATGDKKLVSTGKGRTTCSYFLHGDRRIVYASTHLASPDCPPPAMFATDEQGRRTYVWPLYEGYDIFTAKPDGSDLRRITNTPRYDAEATACPITGRIVFTSLRDGDMELYSMEPDGSDVKRLTEREGLDGGAFFSHDGQKIVQRSSFLGDDAERQRYRGFIARNLMVPKNLEITVLNRDGSNFHKVTHNGKANFAPYWHPDNKRIIFASNQSDPSGRDFELYLIHEDGSGQVQVTFNPSFDSFPMFSPDGRYLVWASNRNNPKESPRDTNIFVAEWVE